MVFSFLIKSLIEHYILLANSVDPDQMLHSVVSDLGLHCLPCPIKSMLSLNVLGNNFTFNTKIENICKREIVVVKCCALKHIFVPF